MADPSGPFAVGVCDLFYARDGIVFKSAKEVTADNHLVARLFYPCVQTAKGHYWRSRWLPSYQYAKGYANFLFYWDKSWRAWLLKSALAAVTYALGRCTVLDNYEHAPIVHGAGAFPVLIFSHGLGGMRSTYSAFNTEIASQGYVVIALEHADGTASSAFLAGKAGFKYYTGWGELQDRMNQTRYRMNEVGTAYRLLQSLNSGQPLSGLKLSGKLDPRSFLKGLLDLKAVAIAGHSYGGATVAALCAEDLTYRCAVCLDPWWGGLPEDAAALRKWQTTSPMLVLGSHVWNVPDAEGKLRCGGERQLEILRAVRYRDGKDGSIAPNGGGAVLCVFEGSTHDTFTDVLGIFGSRYAWIVKKVGFKIALDPKLALNMVARSTLGFLNRHLPLLDQQRQRFKQEPYPAVDPEDGEVASEVGSPRAVAVDAYDIGIEGLDRRSAPEVAAKRAASLDSNASGDSIVHADARAPPTAANNTLRQQSVAPSENGHLETLPEHPAATGTVSAKSQGSEQLPLEPQHADRAQQAAQHQEENGSELGKQGTSEGPAPSAHFRQAAVASDAAQRAASNASNASSEAIYKMAKHYASTHQSTADEPGGVQRTWAQRVTPGDEAMYRAVGQDHIFKLDIAC